MGNQSYGVETQVNCQEYNSSSSSSSSSSGCGGSSSNGCGGSGSGIIIIIIIIIIGGSGRSSILSIKLYRINVCYTNITLYKVFGIIRSFE
jgi:hypothetical protein